MIESSLSCLEQKSDDLGLWPIKTSGPEFTLPLSNFLIVLYMYIKKRHIYSISKLLPLIHSDMGGIKMKYGIANKIIYIVTVELLYVCPC